MSLWSDYERFHRLAVETGDIDPVYPVLRHYGWHFTGDAESLLWLTFLHVAYYDLGSAITVWHATPQPAMPAVIRYPTGTERRAHRDTPQLERHLADLVATAEHYGGLGAWLNKAMASAPTPEDRWDEVSAAVRSVMGNGRWAGFKTCEMLAKVNDYDLAAPDMDHRYSSGPRHGLRMLYPDLPTTDRAEDVADMDQASLQLVDHLAALGLPGADLATAETSLCDFHSLAHGNYYVGHDIDQMLAQLNRRDDLEHMDVLHAARATAFPDAYLGERHGWDGVDKERRKVYMLTKEIVER